MPPTSISRRHFLLTAGSLAGVAASGPFLRAAGLENVSPRKVLHIVCHSHIDAAWLWPWRDGADLAITTFQSAINRMRENPGLCYSHSSMQHYRWVEKADPRLFAEVVERIREGRWEVVGGWPVEPDCNLPSTESFVRQSLYGKTYAERSLGVDVNIGFNPDSFGHAEGLPIILRKAGYRYYVFQRPQENEMKLPLLFWWEGPDGSRVLAQRIYKHYSAAASTLPDAIANSFAPGFDHAVFFLGVGDHGGAVTKKQIEQLLAMRGKDGVPELRWSTLSQFFATVEATEAFKTLPVVKGGLQHHSRGCYSANGEQKFLNRRAERSLGQAETAAIAASMVLGIPYPQAAYTEAWQKTLFNQFHDLLAGTALYSDYQDARDSVGSACDTALSCKVAALESLSRRVDMQSVQESAVFLFNPLPWNRIGFFEYHGNPVPGLSGMITHLASSSGEKIPLQWRHSDSMTNFYKRMAAWVELPPCGYKVFTLEHGTPPPGKAFLQNFRASPTGFGISSLLAPDGREMLSGPIGLVVINDKSDTWAHGVNQFREEIGRPQFLSSTVVEDGAVLRVIRHSAKWRTSDIILDIVQSAGIDAIELRFTIDWREHEQMLKLEIPTALLGTRVLSKTPGATVVRAPTGDEEPSQDWIAIEGRSGGRQYTVGLINSGTYSHDCLDSLLRTVVIRSAPYARHNPFQVPTEGTDAWQDQGRQERRFWLIAAEGAALDLALDRKADELQTPLDYTMDSAHPGTEPWEKSLIEVQPATVAVLAIKRAELAEDTTVIRLQERSGKATWAKLSGKLLTKNAIVPFTPFEMKTLAIRSGELREISLLEKADA